MSRFTDDIARYLQEEGVSSPKDATAKELYNAVSHAAMRELAPSGRKRRARSGRATSPPSSSWGG